MESLRTELHRVADAIADYREGLPAAHVGAVASRDDVRRALGRGLPEEPAALGAVVDELVSRAEGGLIASAGPR